MTSLDIMGADETSASMALLSSSEDEEDEVEEAEEDEEVLMHGSNLSHGRSRAEGNFLSEDGLSPQQEEGESC